VDAAVADTAEVDAAVSALCPAGAPIPELMQIAVAMAGLSQPIHLVGHPSEPNVLYVLERSGAVRIVRDGALVAQPFFSAMPVVFGTGGNGMERGALSLALHPQYDQNNRIFIFFTQPDSTIEEWRRTGPGAAVRVKELYRAPHSATNHQGGNLAFGPDGMLYFSVGDNGDGTNASNPISAYGKIMRINADTGLAPPGNVMGSLTWDYGLRNPWRISFDRMTGDLYIADVGDQTREEIDFEPAGMGGRDYGWPTAEGMLGTGGVRPVLDYPRDVGVSVIGGYVYRGSRYPCLQGRYFYADYDSNNVRSFRIAGGVVTDDRPHANLSGATGGAIYSFGEDGAGEIYILRAEGRVTRIAAP